MIWDIETGTSQRFASSLDKYFNGVQFSDDGTQIAYVEHDQSWSQDNQASLTTYNVATNEVKTDLYHALWMNVRRFKSDGKLIVNANTRPERDVVVDSMAGEVTTVSLN